MTAPRSIPAVVLQALPQCCVICEGDRRMGLSLVGQDAASTPIRCPHCSNVADLHDALGVVAK